VATLWTLATGSPAPTYQWNLNGTPIPGQTDASFQLTYLSGTNIGPYTVTATNALGSVTSNAVDINPYVGNASAPSGGQTASSSTVSSGSTWTVTSGIGNGESGLSTNTQASAASIAGGLTRRAISDAYTYQWFLNGVPIAGASDSLYVLTNASAFDNGAYTCLVTNSAGSAFTAPTTLSVIDSFNPGRLINLSTRANVGTGANQLIAGYVVGGQP
jgi:hypothetical protein